MENILRGVYGWKPGGFRELGADFLSTNLTDVYDSIPSLQLGGAYSFDIDFIA
jgi:hypothetical protein